MAAETIDRSGISFKWAYEEDLWNTGMDANLALLGRFAFHLSVIDDSLTAPPGSPSGGDTYLIAQGSTGSWLTHDGEIAAYDSNDAGWKYYTPIKGVRAYRETDGALIAFNGATWDVYPKYTVPAAVAPNVKHLVVLQKDLNTPPGAPSDGDAYIVGTSPTGAWTGHGGEIAIWDDTGSAWVYWTALEGWRMYLNTSKTLWLYKDTGWAEDSTGGGSGTGDMTKLVYDPTGVEDNAFVLENMTGNLDAGTF